MLRTAMRAMFAGLTLVALQGCTSADEGLEDSALEFEDTAVRIDYDVALDGVPDAEMRDLLEQSLGLYRFQDKGAQSLAFLRRRAEKDTEIVQKILRAQGYYEAKIAVEVIAPGDAPPPVRQGGPDPAASPTRAPRPDPDPDPDPDDPGARTPRAVAHLTLIPGRAFTLIAHRFIVADQGEGAPPGLPDAAALGSPVGKPAAAAAIIAAEARAADALRRAGRPYAAVRGRRAIADMDKAELEVETTISAGRAYRFGDIEVAGLKDVDADYVRSYQTWDDGAPANPETLRDYQQDLMRTSLFDGGSARFPDDPPEGDALPVIVTLEEGPPRTVSAGLRLSTDTGPEARAAYTHRNLFGANETVDLILDIGLEIQSFKTELRKPQYLRPGQALQASFEIRNVIEDAFDEEAVTLALGLERELSDKLTVGAGGLLEISNVTDRGVDQDVRLAGLPTFLRYDGSDDLLDPSRGVRIGLFATPFMGSIDEVYAPFAVLDARGSTYWDLLGDRRWVLAARTRLAVIPSDKLSSVPAPRRLYSGGGGSVRGYREKIIGPLDSKGDPVGGRSAVEFGAEIRARLWGDIGVVGFVDAGAVSTDIVPSLEDGFQFAAGIGMRYHSPVGPLRFDVAVPLNPRDIDDAFQMYISIGQAY